MLKLHSSTCICFLAPCFLTSIRQMVAYYIIFSTGWGGRLNPGAVFPQPTLSSLEVLSLHRQHYALDKMTHKWYAATDKLNMYVRVARLHFSKVFDLINHHLLLDTLTNSGLTVHIVSWVEGLLLDRSKNVIIGNNCTIIGSSNGGATRYSVSPEMFLLYINDLT